MSLAPVQSRLRLDEVSFDTTGVPGTVGLIVSGTLVLTDRVLLKAERLPCLLALDAHEQLAKESLCPLCVILGKLVVHQSSRSAPG